MLTKFLEFPPQKADGLLILPQVHHTGALDAVVKVKGTRIALAVPPENLVFDPQKK